MDAPEEGWEVYARKSKNRPVKYSGKLSQNTTPKAWGNPHAQKFGFQDKNGLGRGTWNAWPTLSRRPAGRGNAEAQASNQATDVNNSPSASAVPPPLQHGWDWSRRAGSSQSEEVTVGNQNLQNDNDSDTDDDSDYDDDVPSDEFDSDASQKSYETRKKNRWLKELFECMDSLNVEELNDPERQWHCPACKDGPGAIDWYRGLQPLVTHAKTKGSSRVKLHRELAELLEEELQRRGTSAIPAGEAFGIWEGVDATKEKDIVWPPMVVVMNTRHDKDENEKWIGMGNQELLDYFNSYDAIKARHSYGPQGHRGMSVLIFKASAVGYLEAERLGKYFESVGRDRIAWERQRLPSYPGGKRLLYGYVAEKRDVENFNQHSQGKSKLKFEIRSYLEMVVNQLKQMSEDNEELIWLRNRIAKEQRHSKAVEESYNFLTEKMRKLSADSQAMRARTKMHHEQNKEEMDHQEQFFKEQIEMIYNARNAKEEDFEKMQQEQREKVAHSQSNLSSVEDLGLRDVKIEEFIRSQDKEMREFEAEREKLLKEHGERMVALKERHWKEEVALEEELSVELSQLMGKYAPNQ